MAHVKTTRGLDIPLEGEPEGEIRPFEVNGQKTLPKQISLNLDLFEYTKFKLLVRVGNEVKIGQPLAEDKKYPEKKFVSPAGGKVAEIRRGVKRRLLDIVIDVAEKEEFLDWGTFNLAGKTPDQLKEHLLQAGVFPHLRQRPFNHSANPTKKPRYILIRALESYPFTPPAEMQLKGHEGDFQLGLSALSLLSEGAVHLVYREGSTCSAFTAAKDVTKHTAEGPHPIGTNSILIHHLSPIRDGDDVVWTLGVHEVIGIGYLLRTGHYFTEKVISIAGSGVLPGKRGYFRLREGMPISSLVVGRVENEPMRLISGNPLTGKKVESNDFLGFEESVFTVIPENTHREFLHFFRLGIDKYTASRTYLSGMLPQAKRKYFFNTSMHGEHRGFISAEPYDKVLPMNISTVHLVKAVMAEDFDLAEELGILEVTPEDFALATFVCPSKIEMVQIMKQGLERYAYEILE